MDWVVLVCSGMLEAVWALALDRAEGFTRLLPSVVFVAALAASMLGLSHAVRTIPIGTAYAVWVGIGAAVTVATASPPGRSPSRGPRSCCSRGSSAAWWGSSS